MPFQIWDTETGNFLESLPTRAEAEAAIDEYVTVNGEAYRQHLGIRATREETDEE